MKFDLQKFDGTLPYASELYGIYQPLLGWKSRLMARRIEAGINSFRRRMLVNLFPRFHPQTELSPGTLNPREVQFRIGLATEARPSSPLLADVPNSIIGRHVMTNIQSRGIDDPNAWADLTRPGTLEQMLGDIGEDLRYEYKNRLEQLAAGGRVQVTEEQARQVLNNILARESVAAGVLGFLHSESNVQTMRALIQPLPSQLPLRDRLQAFDSLSELVDPRKSDLASAAISPIGIVHLFCQYFFEFDTFLGSAVEHLWLNPGGTVELVEVSTRKTIIERATETTMQIVERSSKSAVLEDELSDAVRMQNSSNTKFGVSLNTDTSFGAGPIFAAQVATGTSYELAQNAQEAREQVHRGSRQQSAWISSELKRNFKTTFRVTANVTDTSSRHYTIQNNTPNLMNYELRRKMREVGIQAQDYGSYLCWQTYVDKPGDELGLANLIHIAVPNDMPPRQHPELLAFPGPYRGETIKYSFRWPLDDQGFGEGLDPEYFADVIIGRFALFPNPGFKFDHAEVLIVSEPKWGFATRPLSVQPVAPGIGETTPTELELFFPPGIYDPDTGAYRQVLTDEHPTFLFEITPVFIPSDWLNAKIRDANDAKEKEANQAQEREYKEKLFNAVKERVKLASKVESRKMEDLREEERIIVYRNLIRQLLKDTGVENSEPRVQHIFAELVESMFDIDKMLYFVAPEWWVPRSLPTEQNVFRPGVDQAEFRTYTTVSWGGARAQRPDNYYITEDSTPAKLGSSLGWVIQLDADSLRNAFLNAPWVKAVIPIREGKEKEAMRWLSGASVEGSEGLDAAYQPSNPDELQRIRTTLGLDAAHAVTIRDAMNYLIARIQEKQASARTKVRAENGTELNYLPADKVYEHGFDPLQNGFVAQPREPFEIFDQWIEIVPTDQIVPVSVDYDPKTGLQR